MKKLKMCSICENLRIQGIGLLEQWICSECEKNLLTMDVEHPYYEYHLESVKNMWKSHYLIRKKREPL